MSGILFFRLLFQGNVTENIKKGEIFLVDFTHIDRAIVTLPSTNSKANPTHSHMLNHVFFVSKDMTYIFVCVFFGPTSFPLAISTATFYFIDNALQEEKKSIFSEGDSEFLEKHRSWNYGL